MQKNHSQKQISPPRLAQKLLEWWVSVEDFKEYVGDLNEVFSIRAKNAFALKARIWYWFQVLKTFPLFAESLIWSTKMFKNYTKVALRNFQRHKAYSFINITGLAIGMTCFILIMLWVQDELSYDGYHEHADRVFRVTQLGNLPDGTPFNAAVTSTPLAQAMIDEIPGITNAFRYMPGSRALLLYGDKRFHQKQIGFADPSVLDILTIPFVKGNAQSALSDPHSILINETTAEKYFGTDDPIGQTISYNNQFDMTVTGIIKDTPVNSHLQYTVLIPFQILFDEFGRRDIWDNYSYYTYIQVTETASLESVREQARLFQKEKISDRAGELFLQPLPDIYLKSDYVIDMGGASEARAKYVYIFAVVAFFILFIACTNFMNLTTARSGGRAKEIGMRKVIGAYRSNLIYQFLSEAVLLSFAALAIALLLVKSFLPFFNDLTFKALDLEIFSNPNVFVSLIAIALFTGVLAGSYPALFLSSFRPIKVLKGALRLGAKNSGFMKGLVVTQFTLSVILIIGTMIVSGQLDYIMNKKLGFNKEHLIYINLNSELWESRVAAREELLKHPDIVNVSFGSSLPTYTALATLGYDWEGKDPTESVLLFHYAIDHDFISTFGMEMKEGRDFSREFPSDTDAGYILNETAVEITGLTDPVGKRFSMWDREGTVVGVVKDFHFKSLRQKVEPLVLRFNNSRWYNYAFVKVNGNNIGDTVSYIENTYSTFVTGYPFEYNFLDDAFNELYKSEMQVREVFNYFTFLAIFISCLGLFGLASYMADQRTREFGIRKVLGASESMIVTLLSKDFMKWIAISNVIAWPVAYYAMRSWLQNFAFNTGVNFSAFILAGGISISITLLIVAWHAFSAARTNPARSLNYE